jgi:hypothetical protein
MRRRETRGGSEDIGSGFNPLPLLDFGSLVAVFWLLLSSSSSSSSQVLSPHISPPLLIQVSK